MIRLWREWGERSGRLDWRGWGRVAAGGFGGFLVLSLLPKLIFDYDTWDVWRICLSQHATFATLFKRSYTPWLLFNPVEYVVFLGAPTALLMGTAMLEDARRLRLNGRRGALPLLPWAMVGVLVLANLSGKNLGEVARLWMFLMPFAAIPAGCVLARFDRRRGWVAGCVVAMAAAQVIVFRLHLQVFNLN